MLVADLGEPGRLLLGESGRTPFGPDAGAYLTERGRGTGRDHGAE